MSTGTFSTYLTSGWVDELAAKTIFLALFSADPAGSSNPAALEIIGGVYARQDTLWTRTSPSLLTLNEDAIFRNLPPGAAVAAVGGFDAAFNGNLLFSDVLAEPLSFPVGGTYIVPAGQYAVGFA